MLTQDEIKQAVSDVSFGKATNKYVHLTPDGKSIQMVYRRVDEQFNEGSIRSVLEYLSYANLWQGSSFRDDQAETFLVEIVD